METDGGWRILPKGEWGLVMAQAAWAAGKVSTNSSGRRGAGAARGAAMEYRRVIAAQAAEYAALMAQIDAGLDEIDRIAGRRSAEAG